MLLRESGLNFRSANPTFVNSKLIQRLANPFLFKRLANFLLSLIHFVNPALLLFPLVRTRQVMDLIVHVNYFIHDRWPNLKVLWIVCVNFFFHHGKYFSGDSFVYARTDVKMREIVWVHCCPVYIIYYCSSDIKHILFKTYMYNIYCCSLWSVCSQSVIKKLTTSYNNCFRALFKYPKFCSASQIFVEHSIHSFKEVMRICCGSIPNSLLSTNNTYLKNYYFSSVARQSKLIGQGESVLYKLVLLYYYYYYYYICLHLMF